MLESAFDATAGTAL